MLYKKNERYGHEIKPKISPKANKNRPNIKWAALVGTYSISLGFFFFFFDIFATYKEGYIRFTC